MPRRARLSIPGIPWHIIQRGNNRTACFYADEDYRRYLDTLGEQADKHSCQIHAYVLMTNHVHLLITSEREESAGLLMKHLGRRYVQYVNWTYRRSNTLWEGRSLASLGRRSTFCVLRYIELNPVRADMVSHPRAYRWSSYRTNAEGKWDPLITPYEAKKGTDLFSASIPLACGADLFRKDSENDAKDWASCFTRISPSYRSARP